MLLCSWNVRGLGHEVKRRKVKRAVLSFKPAVLFIQETKKDTFDRNLIRSIGGNLLSKGVGVEAVGSVGADRKKLWEYLLRIQQDFEHPWFFGGDFNTVLNEAERKGGLFDKWSARSFQHFILQAKVKDIPLRGAAFTWSNNKANGVWARLDCFLVSPIFMSWFPSLVQKCVPRTISNHCAITLGCNEEVWGPGPFRFHNRWLEDKKLMSKVRSVWTKDKVKGSSGVVLQHKLKASKALIKRWAVGCAREVLLEKIDVEAAANGWTESLHQDRLKALADFWKALRLEEQEWLQKSRVKWLLNGDRNTRFFQVVASSRRNRNFIDSLVFEDGRITDKDDISLRVADHFERQYRNVKWLRPKISGSLFKKISVVDSQWLEEKFSLDEVKEALASCDGNKAPGPDGFNIGFVKANWEVIEDDFLKFLEEFHRDGPVVKEINRSFIALIPKCDNAEVLSNFRPISLVGSLYKILAKILANRLKKVINSVIGESQMAFVKNRQILDSVVITDEIIHEWRKRKEGGGLMVKLDFEKAYDTLDHSFLNDLLEKMGFGVKWRRWIECCVSTPRLSVLVNGKPTSEFGLEKGLRQGDPLSPLLFIVAAEGLNALLRKATELNMVKRANFGGGEVQIV
ncbi:hypothetical protein LWI29_009285 [Acer saccharum]|uniref:Reverse transcriptase domain-containing protein n=1 Tax=Acer saccharum TaxID=4024 RepID=A0AA39SS75_ACESA|nr:hypothetical protein LWI29_009285 [Acer saccharum]